MLTMLFRKIVNLFGIFCVGIWEILWICLFVFFNKYLDCLMILYVWVVWCGLRVFFIILLLLLFFNQTNCTELEWCTTPYVDQTNFHPSTSEVRSGLRRNRLYRCGAKKPSKTGRIVPCTTLPSIHIFC